MFYVFRRLLAHISHNCEFIVPLGTTYTLSNMSVQCSITHAPIRPISVQYAVMTEDECPRGQLKGRSLASSDLLRTAGPACAEAKSIPLILNTRRKPASSTSCSTPQSSTSRLLLSVDEILPWRTKLNKAAARAAAELCSLLCCPSGWGKHGEMQYGRQVSIGCGTKASSSLSISNLSIPWAEGRMGRGRSQHGMETSPSLTNLCTASPPIGKLSACVARPTACSSTRPARQGFLLYLVSG
jgi:hypothetical protein